MYFWKIESLKQEIKSGSFTDKELIPYVALYAGLYAIGIEFAAYMPYEDVTVWTYVLSVLNVAIPVVGTIYAYTCNGGANGENFASKYFSIGFVIGIRFLAYLIPAMSVLFTYWVIVFGEQEQLPTTFVEVMLFSAWYGLLYVRMAKHIGDTTRA